MSVPGGAIADGHTSAAQSPQKQTNSIEVETRDDLSFFYKSLRSCILRPLRPHLVSLKDEYPPVSPRLTKRPSTLYNYNIVERKVQVPSTKEMPLPQPDAATNTQNMWLYDFEPALAGGKQEFSRRVYYFAGGGFRAPPSGEHWKLCGRMASALHKNGVRVSVVSYPLAPKSPAHLSLPAVQAWFLHEARTLCSNARSNERITLIGDSAGGNMAVGLAFWAAGKLEELKSRLKLASESEQAGITGDIEALQRLDHVFSISAPMDFRNVNPEIDYADKLDPILTKALTDQVATDWVTGYLPDKEISELKGHPALSPILQTEEAWQTLRAMGIRIDGCFGTYDVLAPDCKVFLQKLKDEGVAGSWLIWEGQMHCFPLVSAYGVPEGKQGLEFILKQLRRR